ncbi:sugar transferase [Modestobacter versicolor]|uniref:sugar transferase n=1 Tax=Modestobacter versicolor TaxID=429133 RepID=UPI0034DEDED9
MSVSAPGQTLPPQQDDAVSGWVRAARFGVRPLLFSLDLLAIVIGVVGLEIIGDAAGIDSPSRKSVAFGLVFLVLLALAGMYRSRLSLSVLDDLPTLVGRWLAAAGIALFGQVVWSKALWADYVINWQFLWGAVAIGVALVVLRAVGYAIVRSLRSHGLVAHRTLIIGAGSVGNQVADILEAHPEYGLHPVGFLDADPWPLESRSGLPVVGSPQDVLRFIESGDVRNVVVAFSSMREKDMVQLIRACDRYSVELFVVPRLFELHQVDDQMDNAWGLPLVRLRRSTYRSQAWRVKRLVDVAVSGLALLALAPALALIALAVRFDGGPGILFRQERVGVDGRHFQVLKFRSLRPATEDESATTWNIAHDARLGKVGKFLRKTSLDELPQLFNILRGDMSLVGPRPERPHFVSQFRSAYPSYEARHRVPSGLTGWAQVHGLRGDTSIADRARFDNYYIENWSLWLDVKIVLRTIGSVVRGAGG